MEYTEIARVFGVLILVIGLILSLVHLIKRVGLTSVQPGTDLRVTSQIGLGSRERLVVVQAGEKRLLLGVTAQTIQALCELEPGQKKTSGSHESPQEKRYGRLLQRLLRGQES